MGNLHVDTSNLTTTIQPCQYDYVSEDNGHTSFQTCQNSLPRTSSRPKSSRFYSPSSQLPMKKSSIYESSSFRNRFNLRHARKKTVKKSEDSSMKQKSTSEIS